MFEMLTQALKFYLFRDLRYHHTAFLIVSHELLYYDEAEPLCRIDLLSITDKFV